MTGISERAKSILKAIVEGKDLQEKEGTKYVNCDTKRALCLIWGNDGIDLRIKPETRSINGVTFEAPVPRFEGVAPNAHLKINQKSYYFKSVIGADSAALAICDALEGVTR